MLQKECLINRFSGDVELMIDCSAGPLASGRAMLVLQAI
jgi:hypothetical protein